MLASRRCATWLKSRRISGWGRVTPWWFPGSAIRRGGWAGGRRAWASIPAKFWGARHHDSKIIVMVIGVPRESFPGERRVAIVPAVVPSLAKSGLEVVIEAGAGSAAGYLDADYAAKGARLV